MNMANPTDDPELSEQSGCNPELPEQSPEGKKTANIVEDEELAAFLKSHNLYKDLYQILVKHDFGMDELKNDVKEDEIEDICKDLGLKGLKKSRFNKLMRIINKTKAEEKHASIDDDEDLQTFLKENNFSDMTDKLYKILLSEKITFDALSGMTSHDIEKICDANHIKTGHKIHLKEAILNHQRRILDKKTKKMQKKYDYEIKIVLIGDSCAGKTSLITRYCKNTFTPAMLSTAGVDRMFNYLSLGDDSTIRLAIWDTAGQERYQSTSFSYYRGAQAIVFCYDISSRDSLNNFLKWRQHIEDYANDDVIVELVACKCDKEKERKIKASEIDEIIMQKEWNKYDIKTVECSAKTGDNVNNVYVWKKELQKKQRQKTKIILYYQ